MAQEYTPLINGREYSWADISVAIGGVPLVGIRGIKYTEKQAKENVYGAGAKPIGRAYGRIEFEGSITLLTTAMMAIKAKAADNRLRRIAPFSITVMYQPDNAALVTVVLKNCEFLEDAFDWKEGDMSKEMEVPLLIADIQTKM